MHQVIKNLNDRAHRAVPVNDGRKITLVLFGGLMSSVRGAGALVALQELGLTKSFDEIYSMSAGFLNASYFLSGQMREGAAAYYQDLSGSKFINFWRFWKIADIDFLMDVIKNKKSLSLPQALNNPTKLSTLLRNTSKNDALEFLEVHNFDQAGYLNLLRASASLKYIAGGSVELGKNLYRDIIKDNALQFFLDHVANSEATDILVLYNYPWQQRFVQKQLKKISPNRVCEVCLSDDYAKSEFWEKIFRFQRNSEKLKTNCQSAGNKIKKLFLSESPVKLLD